MILSHTRRFIYFKTVKTAGTTTEVLLEAACLPRGDLPDKWEDWHQADEVVDDRGIVAARVHGAHTRFRHHMTPSELIDALGPDVLSDYTTCANIRNPWDKMVSHFFFDAEREGRMPLKPDQIPGQLEAYLDGYRRWEIDRQIVSPNYRMDTFIRYEHLVDDISLFAQRCGFTIPDVAWPRLKSGSRPAASRDYRPLYTRQGQQAVAELYADWIDAFGYRF